MIRISLIHSLAFRRVCSAEYLLYCVITILLYWFIAIPQIFVFLWSRDPSLILSIVYSAA
jgi:hypothetical protein